MNPLDLIGSGGDALSVLKGIHGFVSKKPELIVKEMSVNSFLPFRIAYDKPINPNLMPPDFPSSLSPEWYRERANEVGYAGSCKIHFAVENLGRQVASIRSISLEKNRLSEIAAKGSICFTTQGDAGGEPIRFYCNLDSNQPSMQKVSLGHHCLSPVGENNYFECGRIEIEPGHTADIVLYLHARKNAFRCSNIIMRAESRHNGTYVLDGIGQLEVTVLPLALIPASQRCHPNYSPKPPCLAVERDYEEDPYEGMLW